MTNHLKIGIIGTAGRRDDASKLSANKFSEMKSAVLGIVTANYSPLSAKTDAEFEHPITFVSGGAAGADHIAVKLFLEYLSSSKLILHLPAKFLPDKLMFEESGDSLDAGRVANHYHDKFWQSCKVDSRTELSRAINCGADINVTPGFKNRNSFVANASQVLIALTFGNGAKLKDGGTTDTMSKFLAKRSGQSWHVDLNTMNIYTPAEIVN